MAALTRLGGVFLLSFCLFQMVLSEGDFSVVIGFQQYTYLIEKEDISLSQYTCDPDRPECKVNLDFRDSFSDLHPSRDYTCIFVISYDPDFVPNDPCNPPSITIPEGLHQVVVTITHDDDPSISHTREISFLNARETEQEVVTGSGSSLDPIGVVFLDIPEPEIVIQTGLHEDFSCKKVECKMNVIVENVSGDFGCRWDFGGGTFVTQDTDKKCNPGYVDYLIGEYMVTLEVYQKSAPEHFIQKTFVIKNVSSTSTGGGAISSRNLKAHISLQGVIGSNKRLERNTLHCVASDTCSVNLDGRESTGNIVSYLWDFGDGNILEKDNPLATHLGLGEHTITLTVTDMAGNVDVARFHVIVSSGSGSTPTTNQKLSAKINLQGVIGKDKELSGNRLICRTKDTCSLNFDGSQSTGDIVSYEWDLGGDESSGEKNPAGYRLPHGSYTIGLTVTDAYGKKDEAIFEVEVVSPFVALQEDIVCDGECQMDAHIHDVRITRVLANPHHTDDLEWVELTNTGSHKVSLWGCVLDDMRDGGSKPFALTGFVIDSKKTLRLYKPQTKLNLNNTDDDVILVCGDEVVDIVSWRFSLPSGYVLDPSMLRRMPTQTEASRVLDGDTIEVIINGKKHKVRLLGVDTPETVHPHKPLEFFGKQASDFTKKHIEGKRVWITFDHDLIDAYGRYLSYVWIGDCSGGVAQAHDCELFNLTLISQGYARMERSFGFMYYDLFDATERGAKKEKNGIWSDSQVTKILNEQIAQEKELYDEELEQEFLIQQEEYLEIDDLDEEVSEYDRFVIQTQSFSTMRVSQRKDTSVRISGQTWGEQEVVMQIGKHTFSTVSSHIGEYEYIWIPDNTGLVTIFSSIHTEDGEILLGEKEILVDHVLQNFLEPLQIDIVVQGAMSKNRWRDGDVFFCRSRKGCSINLDVDDRKWKHLDYLWEYSTGEVFTKKNPTSVKMPHGTHTVRVTVTDTLTGQQVQGVLTIKNLGLFKSTQKQTSTSSKKKVKLSQSDIGGGVVADSSTSTIFTTFFLILLGCLISARVSKSLHQENQKDTKSTSKN